MTNSNKLISRLVGAATTVTSMTGIAAAQGGGMGSGMNGGMGSGMWGYGWLLWAIVLIAILALAYAVVTRTTAQSSTDETDRALETLRDRYARGEIPEEEFEERRERLARDKNRR
jgi:putative membrane protein